MIIRKSVIFFLILLGTAAPSFASDWQPVASGEGNLYHMDFESIAPVGTFKKAWIRTLYFEPQPVVGSSEKKYRSELMLYYFDCRKRGVAMVQGMYYDGPNGKGSVVDSYSRKFNPEQMTEVAPDTIGEELLSVPCGSAASRAKRKAASKKAADIVKEFMKKGQTQD